jgi:hypothetical protein
MYHSGHSPVWPGATEKGGKRADKVAGQAAESAPTGGSFSCSDLDEGGRPATIGIGANVVGYARYVAFQMTEVAASKNPFAEILRRIAELRPPPVVSTGQKAASVTLSTLPGDVRHDGAGLDGVPHATAVPDFRERVTAL